MRPAIALGMLVLAAALPSRARAHAGIDAARGRYVDGDATGALALLEQAEQGPLTLDELVLAEELRVLVQRARGDEADVDRALRTIAALRPDHVLAPEVPDVLRARFEVFARAASGPPRLEVDVAENASGIALTARVEDDPEALVRETRLRARVAGGAWIEGGPHLSIEAAEGARVAWEARAIGPAGAELASARGEHVRPARGGDAWPWVALGAGVLVVGAVVAIAVVAASGVDTRVEGPVIAELRF